MAERFSTGFINAWLATGSVKEIMQDGVIHIFSGGQPATADAAETGDLLMRLTVDSGDFTSGVATNGLEFGTATDGVLSKASGETWSGIGLAAAGTGTVAGWFRWYANTVITGESTTRICIDGQVGNSASYEMHMTNTTIVENYPATVGTATFTPPKQ